MPVKELEREKDVVVVPKEKVEPPKQYQAVLRQDEKFICECNIELLCNVFNLSAQHARDHIIHAMVKGQSPVLIGTKDLIETKVEKATSEAAKGCRALTGVHFTCEPL